MSVVISSISESLGAFLNNKPYSQIFVIADTNTKRHCYGRLKAILPKHQLVTISAGELHKNLETCSKIWAAMTQAQLDRHALVINLGGGVVGDMGGFCAATYKRGLDFVQIPTTLLAQVDASVGGKLGIDFQEFKNHIGVFTQPNAVLIDANFLNTLPVRELRSGFAEVIKHCLIADHTKWHEIRKQDFDEQNWSGLIAHSVAIKQQVVAQDPTEKGLRKILNFGHTMGHAIETYFLSKPAKEQLLHGEAIAAGMVLESFLAYRKKMISLETLEQIEEFMFSIYGKIDLKITDLPTVLQLAQQDKKNREGQLRFSLLNNAGGCDFDVVVSPSEINKAVEYYIG